MRVAPCQGRGDSQQRRGHHDHAQMTILSANLVRRGLEGQSPGHTPSKSLSSWNRPHCWQKRMACPSTTRLGSSRWYGQICGTCTRQWRFGERGRGSVGGKGAGPSIRCTPGACGTPGWLCWAYKGVW